MEIERIGSQPCSKGPAEWFAGTVRIDPLFSVPAIAMATVKASCVQAGWVHVIG
jgi:hypothetical protein